MRLVPISRSNENGFKGKFVIKDDLSKKSKEYLEKFLSYEKEGLTNEQLLRHKSYDMYVSCDNIKDRLVLHTSFNEPFIKQESKCYISTLCADESNSVAFDTNAFRWSLDWFDDYKKIHNGYNNFWEKIVSHFREWTSFY